MKKYLNSVEPEQLKFEVNRAYKTRGDDKVYLFKILKDGVYNLYFVGNGLNFWTDKIGRYLNIGEYLNNGEMNENDIVGYWEEEK